MRAGMLFRVYDVGLEVRLSASVTEIINTLRRRAELIIGV